MVKKTSTLFLLLFSIFAAAACGESEREPVAEVEPVVQRDPGIQQEDRGSDYLDALEWNGNFDNPNLPEGTPLPDVELTVAGKDSPVSLGDVAPGPGRPFVVIVYVPSAESRDAVTALSWLAEAGGEFDVVLIDVGRAQDVSETFAQAFLKGKTVHTMPASAVTEHFRVSDPVWGLPAALFFDDSRKLATATRRPYDIDNLLELISSSRFLDEPALENTRQKLVAELPKGEKFAFAYFKLWDAGERQRVAYLAQHARELLPGDIHATLIHANSIGRNVPATQKLLREVEPALPKKPLARALYHYVEGKISENRRDFAGAAEKYQAAIDAGLGPLEARTYYRLGWARHWSRQGPKAIEAYRAAIQKGSASADAYHRLGELLDNSRSTKSEALEAYRRARELEPWDGKLAWHEGTVLHQLGRESEAVAAWVSGTESDIWFARNAIEAGHCYLWHLFDEDKALELLEAAYRRGGTSDGKHAETLLSDLGVALDRKGRTQDAIAAWALAIERNPKHPFAYFNLAESWESTGRAEDALWAYRKAQEYATVGSIRSKSALGVKRLEEKQDIAAG